MGMRWVCFNIGTMNKVASNQSGTQLKTRKKKFIGLTIIAALIILLVSAIAIPLAMSDGTEKLTADQKKAAQTELSSDAHKLHGMDAFTHMFRFVLKTRVERVFAAPDDRAKSWCGSVYSSGHTYYAVVLAQYTFFGLKVSESTAYDACVLM